GNFHIYIETLGSPTEYCNLLFNRLLLAGYAFPCIHANGVVTVKTLIDRTVASPEREAYEAQPVFSDGLYSKRIDHIAIQEGAPVVVSELKSLTTEEEMEVRQLYVKLRQDSADKAAEAREAYNELRAEKKAKLKGTSKLFELSALNDGTTVYDKTGRPIVELLSSEVILDQQEQEFYVHDVMLSPPEQPVKIPDPVEPYLYGQSGGVGVGVATILSHNMIYSHAHGGIIYSMRWEAQDLIEVLSSDNVSVAAKKLIWRLISTNQQQLASATTDSEISEIADAFKRTLASVPGAGVGNEKAAIKKKLNPAPEPKEAEDEMTLDFNAQFGVGQMQGKTVVVSEAWNKSLNMYDIIITKPFEFEQYYRNYQVRTPGQSGTRSAFAAWMDSPDRNTFHDVYFEPIPGIVRKPESKRVIQQGGAFNIYTGIVADLDRAVYPELILQHMKEVWCSGKEDEFEYLCGWMGHLLQKPNQVNGTALVLQSEQGAGKNIIIDNCIVRHFGPHALSTTRREDFIGRFNRQLAVNVFVYANESIFAGDHEGKNAIKTLITDPFRTIELKGIDSKQAKNYSSVIFGGNAGWMMNIEASDRRMCYLTVNNKQAGDSNYFAKLLKEINGGGSEGFIKYFMEYNINDFDITKIPVGNFLQRNSDLVRSSHPTIKFFLSLVDRDGSIDCVYDGLPPQRLKALAKWHS
ncbi:MAG: primase-helicase family protein, partial [Trichlorobacter sp.]